MIWLLKLHQKLTLIPSKTQRPDENNYIKNDNHSSKKKTKRKKKGGGGKHFKSPKA